MPIKNDGRGVRAGTKACICPMLRGMGDCPFLLLHHGAVPGPPPLPTTVSGPGPTPPSPPTSTLMFQGRARSGQATPPHPPFLGWARPSTPPPLTLLLFPGQARSSHPPIPSPASAQVCCSPPHATTTNWLFPPPWACFSLPPATTVSAWAHCPCLGSMGERGLEASSTGLGPLFHICCLQGAGRGRGGEASAAVLPLPAVS